MEKISKDDKYPFGLTTGEYHRLLSLQQDEKFEVFLRLLDKLSIIHGDAILLANDDSSVHFYRGVLSSLKTVIYLIEDIKNKVDSLERSSEPAADPDRAAVAFYGSPFWSRTGMGTRQK